VLIPEGVDFPVDETMRRAAAELRYSETAFVKRTGERSFRTRYFTPAAEVDLCGHATIATFHALRESGLIGAGAAGGSAADDSYPELRFRRDGSSVIVNVAKRRKRLSTFQSDEGLLRFACNDENVIPMNGNYTNSTLAGDLAIEFKDGAVWMDMAAPEYLRGIDAADELDELYAVMGLDAGTDRPAPGTGASDARSGIPSPDESGLRYPEIISTGLPDILLPVASPEKLNAIKPDYSALAELSERYGVTGVHAFCPSDAPQTSLSDERAGASPDSLSCASCERRPPDGDAAPASTYRCRNFAPLYGIDEESATGTANGALTYYLYRRGVLRPDELNVFIQGEAMGRPSRVLTRLAAGADGSRGVTIKVGGAAVILAAGDIRL
jgi:predicted PhzF superfamily epimerase YddE/YHI9